MRIPKDPFDRVIGQEEAVEFAKLAIKQHRHLLLVGPPGTGKSMIARAMASKMGKPKTEIAVAHNPKNPERPILLIRTKKQIDAEKKEDKEPGKEISPSEAPVFVTERLGFRCKRCGAVSDPSLAICPFCGAPKGKEQSPFDDLLPFPRKKIENKVTTSRILPDGRQETVIYERRGKKLFMFTEQEYEAYKKRKEKKRIKVLVPLNRSTFVEATGASESELLGDVRHDPYGGHPEIGVPPYLRVVPGAVHEAHEGVLYIDELGTLGPLQRYLLTAMQEKKFPIVGRNSTSTGAIVRVDNVPCDFIFVGAVNINELDTIIPPLRSRIRGAGYEVLMEPVMDDTEKNRKKFVQFIAQEIRMDGKIPHANEDAVERLIEEARRWAKLIDEREGLTLRLRGMSGIIKLAGDFAIQEGSKVIDKEHVEKAIRFGRPIEEKIREVYGSGWKAMFADFALKHQKSSDMHF